MTSCLFWQLPNCHRSGNNYRVFLQGEADPNIPTFDGNTALHLAVGRNQVGLAALLITAGADPDAENLDPTFEADDAPRAEPVLGEEKLLPVIQEHESSGTTPLDLAVGNEKVRSVLISARYCFGSRGLSAGPRAWCNCAEHMCLTVHIGVGRGVKPIGVQRISFLLR